LNKLDNGENALNFSSNIDFAKKSLAKLMNQSIEKLSTLLDANESQSNASNMSENAINAASHLKGHRRIHKGKKSFHCGYCSKKFRHSSSLTKHANVHTKE